MIKRYVSCIAFAACFAILTGCTSSATTTKPAVGSSTAGPKGEAGGEKKMAPVDSVGNIPPPPK